MESLELPLYKYKCTDQRPKRPAAISSVSFDISCNRGASEKHSDGRRLLLMVVLPRGFRAFGGDINVSGATCDQI